MTRRFVRSTVVFSILMASLFAGACSAEVQADPEPAVQRPAVESNEPEGFVPIVHEDWNDPDPAWLITPSGVGSIQVTDPFGDGDMALTHIYEEGFTADGHIAGATYDWMMRERWPIYQRAVIGFSENWVGHPHSAINKIFAFFNQDMHIVFLKAIGVRDEPLLIRFAHMRPDTYLRDAAFQWDGQISGPGDGTFHNRASPTREQATIPRGEKVTLELLWDIGTAGTSDGWFKVWVNGVLVLDYADLPFLPAGDPGNHWTQWQSAPVWGGRGPGGLELEGDPDQRFWVFDAYLSTGGR